MKEKGREGKGKKERKRGGEERQKGLSPGHITEKLQESKE